MRKYKKERLTVRTAFGAKVFSDVKPKQLIRKLAYYEDLESRLQRIYGHCPGLLEDMVKTMELTGINNIGISERALMLVDDEVLKYKNLKLLESKLTNRINPVYKIIKEKEEYVLIRIGFSMEFLDEIGKTVFFDKDEAYEKLNKLKETK